MVNIFKEHPEDFTSGSLSCFTTADEVPYEMWNVHYGDDHKLMHLESLKALEGHSQTQFRPFYFIYRAGERVVPFYFQKYGISKDSLKYMLNLNGLTGVFASFLVKLGKSISDKNASLIISGNPLASGTPGFPMELVLASRLDLPSVFESMVSFIKSFSPEPNEQTIVIYKDMPKADIKEISDQDHGDLINLPLEPFMSMTLDPDWRSFKDYLDSLTSKYRVRARSVIKKFEEVKWMDLSADDIRGASDHIRRLYENVESRARIRINSVEPEFFALMKDIHGDDFVFRMFVLDGVPVAFTSALYSEDVGEAQFVGYDPGFNYSHALYHNMLFSFIMDAIHFRVSRLNFGRTATEIKSTVGGRPGEQSCAIHFHNTSISSLARASINRFSNSDFIIRRPFRSRPLNQ